MRTLSIVLLACMLWRPTASASTIQLVQDGWGAGGPLSVLFSGEDSNGDGTVVQSELNSFTAAWGKPLGGLTSWGLTDIEPDGFFFLDIKNYLFFTRNSEFSLVSGAFEGEALASVFDQFLFLVDSSATPPTAVPEPSGLPVLGLAALLHLAWRRGLVTGWRGKF